MNKVKKGNYYKLKTKKFFEAQGYEVQNLEINQRIVVPPKKGGEKGIKIIFIKKDIWGADLIASNRKELLIIQVKSNKSDISTGIKQLLSAPWPVCSYIKRLVVFWEIRAREPEIIEG